METINIGVSEYDGLGESVRSSFNKANLNFTELFARGGFAISTTVPDPTKIVFYHNPSSGKWFIYNPIAVPPAWEEVSMGGGGSGTSSYKFFNQVDEPVGMSQGDEWFQPDDGVVYRYIDDDGTLTWVDI